MRFHGLLSFAGLSAAFSVATETSLLVAANAASKPEDRRVKDRVVVDVLC